jgi:hypothetical protein
MILEDIESSKKTKEFTFEYLFENLEISNLIFFPSISSGLISQGLLNGVAIDLGHIYSRI